MNKPMCVVLASLAVSGVSGMSMAEITVGVGNTFTGGDSGQWNNGQADDPQILFGGPGGLNDEYLRISSDGASVGGKLTVFNNTDAWTGNWIAAGVTSVEMDLRNFDPQGRQLSIRMAFRFSQGPGEGGWCTRAFLLPADGQWHRAVFDISEAMMTRVSTTRTWAEQMSQVFEVRLFHSINPSAVGVNIVSSLGVDNIRALPTPGAGAMLGLGCIVGLRRRR